MEITEKTKNNILGYGSIILGIIFFSSIETASKLATDNGEHLGPFWIASLRFFLPVFIFFPAFFNKPKFVLKDLIGIFVCSILTITIAMTLFFQLALMPSFGLHAGIAAIVFCSNPIFVIFLSPIIAPKHHEGVQRIEGAFIALTGVIIASWSALEGLGSSFIGLLLMFGAAIFFAAHVPFSRPYIQKYGGRKYLGIFFLFGSVASGIIAFIFEGVPTQAQITDNGFALLYLCLFATGLAYFFYFYGFKRADASKGSQFFFLKPILAPIIAFFAIGDKLHFTLIIGVVIILFGIHLAFKKRQKLANKTM